MTKKGRGGCTSLGEIKRIRVIQYRPTFIGFRFDSRVFDRHSDAHLAVRNAAINEAILQEQSAEARKLLEALLECGGVVSLVFNHHEAQLQLSPGHLVIGIASEILLKYCPKAAVVS